MSLDEINKETEASIFNPKLIIVHINIKLYE